MMRDILFWNQLVAIDTVVKKEPLTFIGTIYTSIAPADGIEQ